MGPGVASYRRYSQPSANGKFGALTICQSASGKECGGAGDAERHTGNRWTRKPQSKAIQRSAKCCARMIEGGQDIGATLRNEDIRQLDIVAAGASHAEGMPRVDDFRLRR